MQNVFLYRGVLPLCTDSGKTRFSPACHYANLVRLCRMSYIWNNNPETQKYFTLRDVWPGEFSDFCCVGKVLGVLEPEWIVER